MPAKLKFLFMPADGLGHYNACFGLAGVLRDRGHSVTFVGSLKWKGKLAAQGFIEELYSVPGEDNESEEQCGERWGKMIAAAAPVFSLPPIEMHEHVYLPLGLTGIRLIQAINDQLADIVQRVQPDMIVADVFHHIPGLMDQGYPWILAFSSQPLPFSRQNVPPPFAGLPTTDPDNHKQTWAQWDEKHAQIYKNYENEYNAFLKSKGSKEIKFSFPYCLQHFSPHANLYMYPKELDYTSIRPNPPNFFKFDTFMRPGTGNFEIPAQLKTGPGKLVYFSMGTMGAVELNLMRKLISILSKSPNRFIVSKGPKGEELELPENMWGENYVPQIDVLPLVDLVITHGGNNTITESFYFGKRVLVLPLLFDQPDNAQRLIETGLGLGFNPFTVTEDQLLVAIETLLGDDVLEQKMAAIGRRIQASNSQSRAADLIDQMTRKVIRDTRGCRQQ